MDRRRSINCTVVELKRILCMFDLIFVVSINCTVVELKLLNTLPPIPTPVVLIVPLWN